MKNVKTTHKKIRTIKPVTTDEIEWILKKEYNFTHNRETKFFKILESMAVEILKNRDNG